MAMAPPGKLTAVHQKHLELKASMANYDGWLRPKQYTSMEKEILVAQSSVALSDLSPLAKFDVKGLEMDANLRKLLNHPVPIQIGDVVDASLHSGGKIHGEASCYQLSDEHALITGAPNLREPFSKILEHSVNGCYHIVDVTSALAAVRLIGLHSAELLSKLTELDISQTNFPNKKCCEGGVAEIHAVVVRSDYGRQLSYKLYYGREYGEYFWDVIMEAGHEYQLAPIGVEAEKALASR